MLSILLVVIGLTRAHLHKFIRPGCSATLGQTVAHGSDALPDGGCPPPCDSWSRERRVIAKADWTSGKANPRFVVTSLPVGTELAAATCGTLRLRLLTIGALVTRSVRRVKVALASACPTQVIFAIAAHRLKRAAA
jgi:hypothetical protein